MKAGCPLELLGILLNKFLADEMLQHSLGIRQLIYFLGFL